MECESKTILVIEDDMDQLSAARGYFETKGNNMIYATTYDEARKYIPTKFCKPESKVDGVISDVYFPLSTHREWNQEEPIGVRVAIELSAAGIPFVLNTAGYHHGRKYAWIDQLAKNQGWVLIDSGDDSNHEEDSSSKNWQLAYEVLNKQIDETTKGK